MRKEFENINEIKFESTDMADFWADETKDVSYRLTAADVTGMPVNDNISELRCRLAKIFNDKLQNSYGKLESFCDIKRDTFQKCLKHKKGRNITYMFLAKFCVGCGLTEEETKELFALMGHVLYDLNKYDYVLIREIRSEGDIVDFDEDMKKYCGKSVLSEIDES